MLGPDDGVHVMHSMGDTFALDQHLTERDPRTAIIIGAGYVGLEMAEGFTGRGIQRHPAAARTRSALHPRPRTRVDRARANWSSTASRCTRTPRFAPWRRRMPDSSSTPSSEGQPVTHTADLVLAVVGVRPNTSLLESRGRDARRRTRGRRRRADAHRHPARLRRRRRRRHPPPTPRRDLPAAGHDRAQAGPHRRRERPRRAAPDSPAPWAPRS